MALAPGTRLGVYEVTALLGEGGMGQVYRATDTRLKRQVAIKILPPSVAADHDRLARFQREAEVLASLNHPNVAGIYGMEQGGGMTALVMELVEGDDLSHRIAGGAIPIEEALPIAKQIAEALEAAHEQGIVHRDLKPANVKVRPDGAVKVLDFGLAKGTEPSRLAPQVSQSATQSSPAMMTRVGILLGTAAYMSPEQAAGRPVDKRSDLWAFGVVLMEMLTGQPVFTGETVSHVLAAVLKNAPDWTMLPAGTPAPIRTLLRRCLEKDRRRRLADSADARLEIEEALAGTPEELGAVAPSTSATPMWRRRALPWTAAGVLAAGLAAVLLMGAPERPLPASAPMYVSAELGADASVVIPFILSTPLGSAAAISPDGTLLAFVAQPRGGGAPRLYIRRLEQLSASALKGTEGAASPFFSPDGQWLGFFASGRLKKVAVTGAAPVTLANATNARGGSWTEDGTIVFAPGSTTGLWRVSAAGGTAEPLTTLAPGESTHRWPQVLPDGRILYTVSAVVTNYANAWVAVKALATGEPTIVLRGGFYGRYLSGGRGSPTRTERDDGHLTWVHDGTLFAAPFDLATLTVTGPSMPVVSDVASSAHNGSAQVDMSRTGTLVYLPGGGNMSIAPLDWLTRDGKARPLEVTPADWSGLQIASDGRRLAFSIADASNQDVWTYDLTNGALTPLTFDPSADRTPVWTPDGHRLVYASSRGSSVVNLWWQRADGSGEATRLTTGPNAQYPGSWHPNGRMLAFQENRAQTGTDLLILPVEGDEVSGWRPGTPTVFLSGPAAEQQPRFSPDGQWLAYESDESQSGFEIYIQPFPGAGGKVRVSTNGGTNAVWSRARPLNELLYLAPDGRIMMVKYTAAGGVFQHDRPVVWSETPVQLRSAIGASFDLDPGGTRVVMAPVTQAATGPTHVTLIFDFVEKLRRLPPVK